MSVKACTVAMTAILMATSAGSLSAQSTFSWESITDALAKGLGYEAISRNIKGCLEGDPKPQQFVQLSDLLASQGLASPVAQRGWISSLRCRVREDSAQLARRQSTVQVRSDRISESLRLNGQNIGVVPQDLRADTGSLVAISVGDGDYRKDTTVKVIPDRVIIAELLTISRRAEATVDRQVVALDLAPLLLPIPETPPMPLAPKKPGLIGLLGSAAFVGAVSASVMASRCATWATAPSPYGGFLGNEYYPPGSFSSSLRARCVGAVGGVGALAGGLLSHLIDRVRYRSISRSYIQRQSRYQAQSSAREAALRTNEAMVDSAFAARKANAERTIVERRWSITVRDRVP